MLKAFIIISDDIPHVAGDLLLLPWVWVWVYCVQDNCCSDPAVSWSVSPGLTMAGCWLPAIFCFPVTGGCSRCSRLWRPRQQPHSGPHLARVRSAVHLESQQHR